MKLESHELAEFLKDRVRINTGRGYQNATHRFVTPCIEWIGGEPCGRNGAYRRVWYKGKRYRVHRLVWLLSGRQINVTDHLDHLCCNPICVAISHLEAVTPAENQLRKLLRRSA